MMGAIKGQTEWNKHQKGIRLTRKQAMLAHRYECNGFEGSRVDCESKVCALYPYSPYGSK